jgi:isopentenyl phosphate kinase
MIFLKLGGSLITDKSRPETPRTKVIARLATEIAHAFDQRSDLRLLLGHGSGSFGHPPASRHKTHLGAASRAEWIGFAEVWAAAQRLNRLVIDSLIEAGLPAIAFPPSSSTISKDGVIHEMAHEPIQRTLDAGLLPVVYGDVAIDLAMGSTIVSTEKVFAYMASHLRPQRILLAGLEPGVYANYPESEEIFAVVTEGDVSTIQFKKIEAPDVTGGMWSKVQEALAIAREYPGLEVRIFSGEEPGTVANALLDGKPGTLITM